jgi:hypothetical protein
MRLAFFDFWEKATDAQIFPNDLLGISCEETSIPTQKIQIHFHLTYPIQQKDLT